MFMGQYYHNLDEKNRLVLPTKFRHQLGEKFIVTQGLEGCLFIYTETEWQKIMKDLNKLPFTKKDARIFARIFISGATVCEFDKQGRINITSPLVAYAGIKKETVIIGVNDRIEIWSKEKWDEFFNQYQSSFENIAENLFNGEDCA